MNTSTIGYIAYAYFYNRLYYVLLCELVFVICRAPVSQSVAKRAVNPGVVSKNPSSASILSDVRQNQLLEKKAVWITGVRKPGNTRVVELAAAI